jgi:hypothetical protein
VRMFVQRIGLADPAVPELPAPLNVPGELVAARDAQTFFTVELARRDAPIEATLHRVQVEDGVARIAASRLLGERHANHVTLVGDRLLVDLGDRLERNASPTGGELSLSAPVRLLVLDADSLELAAEGDMAYGAIRLGASASTVVYATWGGVLLVDASAPGDAARRRLLPGNGLPPLSTLVHFSADRLLLVDPDGGLLQEIAREPWATP